MEVKKTNIPGSKIRFDVQIEPSIVQEKLKGAFDQIERRGVSTSGFRKGKIPRSLLEKRFSSEGGREVIKELVFEKIPEILANEKISPITQPVITNLNFSPNSPLVFSFDVEVIPDFTLCDYKNIKISQSEIDISDKEIEEHFEVLRKEKAELVEKEGPVQNGDIAVIDLIAYLPKEAPKENSGLYVEIGSFSFPERLEDELIGLNKGDEKVFYVEIPKDSFDKKLAGKKVKFKVFILAIKERILPKLDDNFAKMCGNFKNLKELKKIVKKNLITNAGIKEREKRKLKIVDELIRMMPFDPPQSMVEEERKRLLLNFAYNLSLQNIPISYALESDERKKSFMEEINKEAEKRIKRLFILSKIAYKERIDVSDSEYEEWARMHFSHDDLDEALSNEKKKFYKEELRIEKTLEFLIK